VSAIQTINDLSLWQKLGWRDRYKTHFDVVSHNDITSALSLREFAINMRLIGV